MGAIGDSEFDTATAVQEIGAGRYAAEIDPAWSIGGRPNGGYLLAILARAGLLVAGADHPDPLAISASFPSSPAPGPVEIDVEVVRRGRAFTVVRARMTQDGVPQLDAVATCGRLPDDGRDAVRRDHPARPARRSSGASSCRPRGRVSRCC